MIRSSRGFTLIEMLVAVTVLAIALSAVIAGMARFAGNAARLRERTVALWVAHDRLTEIDLDRKWPDIGKSDGDMQMAGQKWKWKVEVKTTPDPHLRRVDIIVLNPDGKGNAATLSAFLADTGRV